MTFNETYSSKYAGLICFLVSFGVLFFFYAGILFHPNDFLFSASGDGIKNYYTYLYHAANDDSFSHFSGMNYPYYEHIVYTDAHPILSWIIGRLGLVSIGVGILNYLMLLSYPIAAYFLFKILKHYKVNAIWAIAGGVVLAFMSPQVYRLTGHFSLSYVFAIPIMWWLLIQYYQEKRIKWSFIIGTYIGVFFFIHPYLGLILAFFGIVFWFINVLIYRKTFLSSIKHLFLQTLLPIIFFQLYVNLTDTHLNRLSNPAGFFNYYANWKSILVAHDGPLSSIYRFFGVRIGDWETWAYIGASSIFFLGATAVYLIKKRKKIAIKVLVKKELVLFLLAAYLILIFSFCFPLKYDWLRWITDFVGPIKQFRVLGRFTWVFFYVGSIAGIVGFHHFYFTKNRKWVNLIFAVGIIFYCFEFFPVHNKNSIILSQEINRFKYENIAEDLQELTEFVDESNYDAILFLPFHHMSSENIMILGAERANRAAILLSYHTQKPLFNSSSSRMSFTESIAFNNFFSPEFIEKKLTYDLPEEDEIIIIKNKDYLKKNELPLTWVSKQIFENETYIAFHFDRKKWNTDYYFNEVLEKEKLATTQLKSDWKSDTIAWFFYDGFDGYGNDLPDEQIFCGAGAFKDAKSGWNNILTLDKEDILPGEYSIKFWYYLRVDRPDITAVCEQVYADTVIWGAQFDARQPNLIVEDWELIEMNFTVTEKMESLNILITGNGNGEDFIIDELLIQELNGPNLFKQVMKNNVNFISYNNYWINRNSFQSNK